MAEVDWYSRRGHFAVGTRNSFPISIWHELEHRTLRNATTRHRFVRQMALGGGSGLSRTDDAAMPRYLFDVIDAGVLSQDQYGVDLACDDEARNEGLSLLPAIVREALPDGDQHEFRVQVRNEADAVVDETRLMLNGEWWPERR